MDVRLFALRTDDLAQLPLHRVRSAAVVASGRGRSPATDIASWGADVIHVHNLFPNFGRRWVESVQAPVVATLHNFRFVCANGVLVRDGRQCTDCPDGDRLSGLRHRCYRGSWAATVPVVVSQLGGPARDPVLARADRLLCLSDRQRGMLSKRGIPDERLVDWTNFLPDHLDPERMPGPAALTREGCLYVGRVSSEKGVLELVESWNGPGLLRVVGDGPELDAVRAAAAGRSVEVLGRQSRAAVVQLMRRSHALVMPGPFPELAPLAFVEALASRLPVVVRPTSDLAPVVQAEGLGHVVDSYGEVAAAVDDLAGRPRVGDRCREVFTASFTEQAWLQRLADVYRAVGDEGAPVAPAVARTDRHHDPDEGFVTPRRSDAGPQITVEYCYSDSNKGDLAITTSTVQLIASLVPAARTVLQSVFPQDDPDFTVHHRFVRQLDVELESMPVPSPRTRPAGHGRLSQTRAAVRLAIAAGRMAIVERVPSRPAAAELRRAVAHVTDADLVVLKGGQCIYNDQGGVAGLLYLWRMLSPIRLAARHGTPVVMLGQSVGPLRGRLARRMTAGALSHCTRLVVRESRSQRLLAQLGLTDRTVVAPDMAFLVEPRRPSGAGGVLRVVEQRPCLAVTVVNWRFPGSVCPDDARATYESVIAETCARVQSLLGLDIVLVPQVTVRHHGRSDRDVLGRLAGRLEDAGVSVHVVTDDLSPEGLSYVYGRARVLLGTRLHSCILAATAGCPAVAIRYQGVKTEGVMGDLGMGDQVHDIAHLRADDLISSIEHVLANRDALSQDLLRRVAAYRQNLRHLVAHELQGLVPTRALADR